MKSESTYKNDLLEKLNPAVLTAGACLVSSAAAGDPDAKSLAAKLMEEETRDRNASGGLPDMPEEDKQTLIELSEAISSAVLARYSITNRLFDILKMKVFVDIGCGFTQRGIALSRKTGTTYYGIDLPSVTERLVPAVSSVIGAVQVYNRITYHTADATDGNALRSVIHGRSPLFISTEGVMMYLTVPEAVSVTDNICRLLEELGGVWVTADPEMSRLNDLIVNSMFKNDAGRVAKLITGIGKSRGTQTFSNGLTAGDGSNADAFLEEHGFDVRRVPASDLLEGIDLPDKRLYDVFRNINFRIMTSKKRYDYIRSPKRGEAIKIDREYGEEQTVFYVSGRIDTITAPVLMAEYEKLKNGKNMKKLVIDMGEVIYVSSAGIRALLIILKQLGKPGFELINLTPEVTEIFHTTGLTEVL